jgi:hypothetical protein
MARTATNTVDYFPHKAVTGKTLFIIRERFGNDGYAFWFQLLELLCRTENHVYDCRDEINWHYLLAQTGVDEIPGTEMLALLAKLGKIDPGMWDHKIVWCQKLVDNLKDVYKKRNRPLPEKPNTRSFLAQKSDNRNRNNEKSYNNGILSPGIPQSKVKESKVKESKYSELFEQFWKTQLSKIGKGRAFSEWKRACKKVHAKKIIESWHEQRPRYQQRFETKNTDPPHPATWLSQERWNDDVDSICKEQKTENDEYAR